VAARHTTRTTNVLAFFCFAEDFSSTPAKIFLPGKFRNPEIFTFSGLSDFRGEFHVHVVYSRVEVVELKFGGVIKKTGFTQNLKSWLKAKICSTKFLFVVVGVWPTLAFCQAPNEMVVPKTSILIYFRKKSFFGTRSRN